MLFSSKAESAIATTTTSYQILLNINPKSIAPRQPLTSKASQNYEKGVEIMKSILDVDDYNDDEHAI